MRQKLPVVSLFVLASVYLLYWNLAEYVLDDWMHFRFYRQAQGGGWGDYLYVLRLLFENRLYGGFQLFWVSQWINALLVWTLGYAPQIAFGVMVLVHAVNSSLFYVLLTRLRVDRRIAYLAAAGLVLIPTSHGPLFWPVNCSFYVWPLLWLLLYLLATLRVVEKGRLRPRDGVVLALWILLTLFSGSPAFALLVLAPLWMALCFFRWKELKLAVALALLNWTVVAAALTVYRSVHRNPRPPPERRERRFVFTYDYFRSNLRMTGVHLEGLSAVTREAYYDIRTPGWPLVVGAVAALLVLGTALRLPPTPRPQPLWRVGLFAAGMWVLAYAPVMVLHAKTLRHYYTFSPYLALLLALPFAAVARAARDREGLVVSAGGALLCGYFGACTLAEIRQCWIPMSRQTQEFKQRLTELKDLSPEDWIVLPGVRISLGTAPQFAVPGAPWNRDFAEYVTGVPNLYFAREVVLEQGRLRFFHQHFMRDSAPEEMRRVHIIAPDETGAYRPRRYLAYERRPGLFQLLALSGSPPPPSGDALLTRDQLRPLETEIFFPKPFEHGNPEHLKY